MRLLAKSLVLVLLVFGAAACGSNNSGCDDIVCLEGTSCLLEEGEPTCVPNGDDNGGGGSGGEGDACETSSQCSTGLTCRPGVNGVLSCQ